MCAAALTRRAQANNGKERKDLYSDNWDGDVYKGAQTRSRAAHTRAQRITEPCCGAVSSPRLRSLAPPSRTGSGFNVLNLVILAFVLTPVLGLAFAYWSYGTLWG